MRILSLFTLLVCFTLNGLFLDNTVHASSLFEHPIYHSPLKNTVGVDGDIVSLAEDGQGFIWFVSDNGLWRWDSHTAVRASFDADADENPSPQIQRVHADHQGQLWVGTSRGLYTLKAGTRQLIPVIDGTSSHLSVQEISTTEQTVFIATDRELYQYSHEQNSLQALVLPFDARIHALFVKDGTLWVGTGKGLLQLDVTTSSAALVAAEGFPPNVRISAITSSDPQSLLVGTASQGLFEQTKRGSFEHISLASGSQPWIYSITQVDSSTVLLGTFGKGLIKLDLNTKSFRQSRFNALHPSGLAHDNVWALMTDSRGLVWMGVNTALQLYDIRNKGIKRILGGLGTDTGLAKRQVNSVRAIGSNLIVGTGSSGVERLLPTTGQSVQLWDDGSDPIETLVASGDASVFASSNFSSVMVNTDSGEHRPVEIPGRPVAKYSSAFAQTGDTVWVGGTDGLWAFNTTSQTARNLLSTAPHERRVASLLATDDRLWVGTWRGLYAVELPITAKTVVEPAPNAPALLNEQFVATLFIDSQSQVWVGTSDAGLFVYRGAQGWQHIDVSVDQSGGRVEAIAGETQGYVFASTSKNIIAVNIDTLDVEYVVDEASAINRPFRRGAGTKTLEGVMVFGGANGLTLIDADSLAMAPAAVPIILTNVNISTDEQAHQSLSLLIQGIPLPALVKRVSIEFTALDYLSPKKLKYRYRLKGFDNNWSITDAEHRVATFTQLSPGAYTFEVQYSDDGLTWQENGLERRLMIPPAWHQTWLAKGIGLILIIMAALFVHRFLVKQLRQRQLILEQRVADRTAELVKANKTLNQQAEALREASLTDALTGLHNRRFLSQHIERDIAKLDRYYADCTKNDIQPDNSADILFFLIDIDHFKSINDTYGHQIGDQVLIETSNRLRRVFREIDYLIRWGGEEFLVVVHNTSRHEATILAERVIDAIGGERYPIKGGEVKSVTCSIGYSAYPLAQHDYLALNWEDTIGVADAALYAAKNNNRDTWIGVTALTRDADADVLTRIQQDQTLVFGYAKIEKRMK
ncbi:diguanylate cyclase [Alteromonas facilis]|uniref:ligand-binding sensor domain-containing diguanylate cyclase n=1 Tax=Alteromonas facilis TaxID=2048004 RepID=UPI000C2816CB|nr:diguanylate cyclase [Alteromonas facilis]